jgi:2-oxoglutarate dehydrogenase E1 component
MNQMGLKINFSYVGRPDRASPATGSVYRHKVEQQQLVADVFKA